MGRIDFSVKWIGTWFGLGLLPRAPGTFGTLGALPLVWWLSATGVSDLGYLGITLFFTVIGVMVAQLYEDTVAHDHDSPEFVFDEVVGFMIAMALVPFRWEYVLVAFSLFRLLDVLKPWPISWIDQKVKGGIGTMADDIVAGILTNIVVQVWLQKWGGMS